MGSALLHSNPRSIASALALAAACAVISCAAAPPATLVVRAGRLFDGDGGPTRNNVRLVITEGVIQAIEADGEPLPAHLQPSDTVGVVDARDLTVMPGLIDVHTHMASSGACTVGVGIGATQIARNLYAAIRAGVTTVADLGGPPEVTLAMRRWTGTARHRGPRVMVAGPMLTVPDGYLTKEADGELVEMGAAIPLTDPGVARATVRHLFDLGVDLVKVGLQEVNFRNEAIPLLEGEILCAAVEEAHRLELRVVAHATGVRSYEAALDCGVDALVHGPFVEIEDGLIQRVADLELPVAPTLFVFDAMAWGPAHLEYLDRPAAARALTPEIMEDLRAFAAQSQTNPEFLPDFMMEDVPKRLLADAVARLRANVPKLRAAGIPLAMGTDSATCFNYSGSPIEELRRLVEVGLSPAEALQVGTAGSARLLNLGEALGKARVGYRADLIAVDGRPDEDIDAIQNVRHVILDGLLQEPSPPGIGAGMSLGTRILWTYAVP